MKNKLQNLYYKIVKRLINRSRTAMQIVIEYRNEVADFYEQQLDIANGNIKKLCEKINKLEAVAK